MSKNLLVLLLVFISCCVTPANAITSTCTGRSGVVFTFSSTVGTIINTGFRSDVINPNYAQGLDRRPDGSYRLLGDLNQFSATSSLPMFITIAPVGTSFPYYVCNAIFRNDVKQIRNQITCQSIGRATPSSFNLVGTADASVTTITFTRTTEFSFTISYSPTTVYY
eukprot:TRINITY_DN177_c0_g2_i1.p1 TRINITY_DN177_c0_g2~~TRINITY_DN177_c0_g2_i1.p1  ORF type:complete len:166 (+),score=30.39 TRINITY_DN177_c0_g2_i1:160-657(+)